MKNNLSFDKERGPGERPSEPRLDVVDEDIPWDATQVYLGCGQLICVSKRGALVEKL
jgi:hypothetical protein